MVMLPRPPKSLWGSWLPFSSLLVAILASGCLEGIGCSDIYSPPVRWSPPPSAHPFFRGYDTVRSDSAFGWIVNGGPSALYDLRVAVNFACDSLLWVRVSKTALAPGDSARLASPSETVKDVSAGPPIARIVWDRGTLELLSPAEVVFDGWLSRDDTSAVGHVTNHGGDTADSLRIRVETRHGILEIPTDVGVLAPRLGDVFRAAARDSAGVSVYPRVLGVTWVNHLCSVIR